MKVDYKYNLLNPASLSLILKLSLVRTYDDTDDSMSIEIDKTENLPTGPSSLSIPSNWFVMRDQTLAQLEFYFDKCNNKQLNSS